MKKKLFFLLLGAVLPMSAYAIDAPKNLVTDSVSDTKISLNWDDVTGASGYFVYYGKQSGKQTGKYDTEGVDIIEKSEFTLENLDPDSQYYFAVTSIDDKINESSFSNEISAKTLKKGDSTVETNFKITGVKIMDESSLVAIFSKNIDSKATLDFKLTEKESGKEIMVIQSEVSNADTKQVVLLLDETLEKNTQYKLEVLDISDVEGNTIVYGVDALTNFTTKDFSSVVVDMNAGSEEVIPNEETKPTVSPVSQPENPSHNKPDTNIVTDLSGNMILNSAQGNAGETTKRNGNISGSSLSGSELEKNALSAAGNVQDLPKTGPEHVVLVFLALTLGLFFMKRKKVS